MFVVFARSFYLFDGARKGVEECNKGILSSPSHPHLPFKKKRMLNICMILTEY